MNKSKQEKQHPVIFGREYAMEKLKGRTESEMTSAEQWLARNYKLIGEE
jgi:hypothetical protein